MLQYFDIDGEMLFEYDLRYMRDYDYTLNENMFDDIPKIKSAMLKRLDKLSNLFKRMPVDTKDTGSDGKKPLSRNGQKFYDDEISKKKISTIYPVIDNEIKRLYERSIIDKILNTDIRPSSKELTVEIFNSLTGSKFKTIKNFTNIMNKQLEECYDSIEFFQKYLDIAKQNSDMLKETLTAFNPVIDKLKQDIENSKNEDDLIILKNRLDVFIILMTWGISLYKELIKFQSSVEWSLDNIYKQALTK